IVVTAVVFATAWWPNYMYDRGELAAELGYSTSSAWEALNPEGLRPVTLSQLDPDVDPLGVCGGTAFAASLVEPDTGVRWLLLRPLGADGEVPIDVVELPTGVYAMWIEGVP